MIVGDVDEPRLLVKFSWLDFQVSTAQKIIGHFEGCYADLVVCDGAPDGKKTFLGIPKSLFHDKQWGSKVKEHLPG